MGSFLHRCFLRFYRRGISDERGSSLATCLSFLPLVFALSIYAMEFSRSLGATFHDSRYLARRHALEVSLTRTARAANIIYSSVLPVHQPESAALYRCLLNEPTDLPGDCQTNNTQPVAFYDEEGQKLTGSSSALGACYDESGMRTDAVDACRYRVWTELKALCANGAAACNVAKGFNVTFHFETDEVVFGIRRAGRVFDYYIPVADLDFGGVSLITWDFQVPIVWDGGVSTPYTSPSVLMMSTRVGCIDLTGVSCGAGTSGLSTSSVATIITSPPTLPAPPPPPPQSTACQPGFRPTVSGCVAFSL